MTLQLKNLDRSIKRAVQLREYAHRSEHLDDLGGYLALEHRQRVPEDEGTLKGSIRHKVIDGGKKLLVGVGREAWYWILLEKGTRPHPITAKPGRATRRRKGAQALAGEGFGPVQSVPHPGIRPPRPFVRPVLEDRYPITQQLKDSLKPVDYDKPITRRRRRRRR